MREVDAAQWIEEACLNGWPALRQIVHAGLLLRFSEEHTRRANSVNAIGPLTDDPRRAIRFCENAYRALNLPTIFRLSSAWDQGLGPALDEAGYEPPEDETLVLVRDLASVPRRALDVADEADDAWLDALARIQGQSEKVRSTHRNILKALALPAGFASATVGDDIASLCFGAVHDGTVCVNSVATDPRHRRLGLARGCIEAVLAWAAHDIGATRACVPVVADNAPALTLYRNLGFDRVALRYHYRRQAPRP